MIAQALAVAFGLAGVTWVLSSVIRTVVIPRPAHVWSATTAFELGRRGAHVLSRRLSPRRRHNVLGTFAPVVVVSLPFFWSLGVIASFAAIYWGADVGSVQESVALSGSALTTLGFLTAPDFTTQLLAIVEALIGLAIMALMISFLPTLYGTFSRREVAVGSLTTRAGAPPSPISFVARLHAIDRLDHVGDRWEKWEDWFVELGETHTSFPALIYFRSASPDRSWATAAETALDAAAIVAATKIVPPNGQADTMIRSGYLALRSIADFYGIEPERPPTDIHALSVDRYNFEAALDRLEAHGIPIAVSRDDAWAAFAGWRVNYDRAVGGLFDLIGGLSSHWSTSDEIENSAT